MDIIVRISIFLFGRDIIILELICEEVSIPNWLFIDILEKDVDDEDFNENSYNIIVFKTIRETEGEVDDEEMILLTRKFNCFFTKDANARR